MLPLWAEFRARGIDLAPIDAHAWVPLGFGDPASEHLATRRAAGLFDFSFMGCFEFAGERALDDLHRLQTRYLGRMAPGAIAYTLLLREDGTVFNDATIWRLGPQHYWMFTGRRTDLAHLQAHLAGGTQVRDLSGAYAVLALQGPLSRAILARVVAELPAYFAFTQGGIAGLRCRIARLGYSGELGYEILVDAKDSSALWHALLESGRGAGLVECGFESADSLRIETGYVLFSRELARPVTPWELGLGRLVAYHRGGFVGAQAIRRAWHREPRTRLTGLLPDGPAAPSKPDAPAAPGRGVLTSVRRSPVFGRDLALGFVAWEDRYPGTRVLLGDGIAARVARIPFYDPLKRLPRT